LIDRTVFPGAQGGPLMNTIAAKAVAFGEASTPEFAQYAEQVLKNAKRLAHELMQRGFKLVTNGTDNHLILADVKTSFDIHGGEAEAALDAIGLNCNKNVIPDDTLPAFRPSGLRLGTPAITTRGLDEEHMAQIAEWMQQAIQYRSDIAKLGYLKNEIARFAKQFPLPSDTN